MASDDYIVFGAPAFDDADIEEVIDSIKNGWVGTGPKVHAFEKIFADYKGVPVEHVAAVSSCTAALHLSMVAAGISEGDEVITTAMTFCATVNAIVHTGATPVLVDIDVNTKNIDASLIEQAITEKTKAILPVHFSGLMCDMASILALADKYDLAVIEDCAHAIESERDGFNAGTLGDFGCFSFYATKNITTAEGGMVIGKDIEAVARIKRLALHGLSDDAWSRYSDNGFKTYTVADCGFKYNLTDLHAALGINQLKRVDELWQRRKKAWDYYCAEIDANKYLLPAEVGAGARHGYHLFTLQRLGESVSRDFIMNQLHKAGVGAGIHYLSIPEHEYYHRTYGFSVDDYPNARDHGMHSFSIPLSANLTQAQLQKIVSLLNDI